MKVLVTGGEGYVGSRLVPHLEEQGHEVWSLDLGLFSLEESGKRRLRGDVRSPETVRSAVAGMDAVVHLAAISNDPTGQVDEILTRQVNFDAVEILLSEGKRAKVKRFINASSSSVYGIKKEDNVTEELEPEPLTHYSKYKALSEKLVTVASTKDFVTVNLRPATICGQSPRQRYDLAVNAMLKDAYSKEVITVEGGTQRRPNVGMTDVIDIYAKLLVAEQERINGETFNFGFENLTIMQMAEIIADKTGAKIKVTDTKDVRDYHISSDKIMRVLGFTPKSSIRREIESFVLLPGFEDPIHYNMKSMKLERFHGNRSPQELSKDKT